MSFPATIAWWRCRCCLGNNTLRLGFHFAGDRSVAGDECVRTESSGSGSLVGLLLFWISCVPVLESVA
jgi:hypothetical protein